MRKFLFSFLMLLFFVVSLPVYAAEIEPLEGFAIIDVDSLNVRSGPSKDFEKIGSLVRDSNVDVKGFVEPDWYLIDYEGTDGYINSEYVIFMPSEEIETDTYSLNKKYLVMALVVAILILSGLVIYTVLNIRKEKESEDEEHIPITDHDDTNMHIGEVTYDTYRIDIDPKYFEQTSVIPQPESVYDNRQEPIWKKDLFGEASVEEQRLKEQITAEVELQELDSKLEQASAQIAALQKEVEQLKKQQTDSI